MENTEGNISYVNMQERPPVTDFVPGDTFTFPSYQQSEDESRNEMEFVLERRREPDLNIGRLQMPAYDRTMSITWQALRSLRPNRRIRDDALEFYIHLLLKKQTKLCFMDNNVVKMILNNDQAKFDRTTMRKVNFDNYEGCLGFVNLTGDHWTLFMMNQTRKKIMLLDSLYVFKDQEVVADRLKKWFQVRNQKLGGRDPRWTATDWKLVHCHNNPQPDTHSCGVFVCIVARYMCDIFPKIPRSFHFDMSLNSMMAARHDCILKCLMCSDRKDTYCVYCHSDIDPKASVMKCEVSYCGRVYKTECLKNYQSDKDEDSYECEFCLKPTLKKVR